MRFYDAIELLHGADGVRRAKAHRCVKSAIALADRSSEFTARARAEGSDALMRRALRQNLGAQRLLRWANELTHAQQN